MTSKRRQDCFFDRPHEQEVSKQHGSAWLEMRPTDFHFQEFRLDYEKNKNVEAGRAIFSDPFSAGGHMWRISCFPRGNKMSDKGEYLSVFLEVVSKPWVNGVGAVFDVFLMGKNGEPAPATAVRTTMVHLFQLQCDNCGYSKLISQTDLVKDCVTEDGQIRIICGIMIVNDRSIPVPPSEIVEHLGNMLDSTDGADVSFIVGSETFQAHRSLLAARSPVFRVELFGSMAEATAPSITLHDIAPATFKLMLRFMYTDTFPVDGELGDCPIEMTRHLLAAADRYALDRLKLMCAQKLWDNVSVNTVAATLACAEMYNCLELKIKCMDFFAMEKNFRKAVLTDGFVQLVQQFPSIIAELRKRPPT